jgi:DNA-binding LytR/AlgR family response regulator
LYSSTIFEWGNACWAASSLVCFEGAVHFLFWQRKISNSTRARTCYTTDTFLPMIEIVAKVKSPIQAIEVFQLNAIDLLYLDIQMPTINGNQLLKTLPYQPITIFTTAYSEYAVEAFELGAIDYLVKPFFV